MKRFGSLILAAALLASAPFAVNSEEQNNRQADRVQNFLTGIGAIADGESYELDAPMTRGAYVNFVADVLDMETPGAAVGQPFADVDAFSDCYAATGVLRRMGAITPDESGNFYPDRIVVYSEAVKILVDVLGYQGVITAAEKYPAGYLDMAARLGLDRGMSAFDQLTAADAFVLMGNALEADVAKVYAVDDQMHASIEKGYTLLEDKLHIAKDTGRIEANFVTGLSDPSGGTKGHLVIDGTRLVSAVNANLYLGYSVDYYYTTEGERQVVYVAPRPSNQTVTFAAEDIVSFENMKYSIAKKEDRRTKSYPLNRNVDVIYNQIAHPAYDAADFVPLSGTVTLLDSENDGIYETVFINAVADYVVDSVTTDGQIYDLLGKPPLDLSEDLERVTILRDGAPISYTALSKYDVLSVAESRAQKGDKHIAITVSNQMVSGFVTAFEDKNVVIDNTAYELSPYLTQALDGSGTLLPKLKLDESLEAYLNEKGQLTYYKTTGSELECYGYMTKALWKRGLEDTVLIRVVNENGDWQDLTLKDTITLDGKDKIPCSTFYQTLTQNGAQKVKAQLIRYRVNKNGIVQMIDTQTLTEDEEEKYSLTASDINKNGQQWTFKRSSRSFDGFFSLDNNTKVFSVPGDGAEDDETLYQVGNAGYFTEGGKYEVHPYNLTDAKVSDVVIVKGAGRGAEIAQEANLILIEKVSTVYEDGEEKVKLSGLSYGAPVSLMVKDSSVQVTDRPDMDARKEPSVLGSGDVIRAQQDALGRITDMERLVDMSQFGKDCYRGVASKFSGSGGYRDGYSLRGAFVYAKQDDIIAVTDTPTQDLTDPELFERLITYSTQPTKVMLYNIPRKIAEAGSANDIIPYTLTQDQTTSSFLYIRAMNGDPKEIIVFQR